MLNQNTSQQIYCIHPGRLLAFLKKNKEKYFLLNLSEHNDIPNLEFKNIILLKQKPFNKEKLREEYIDFIGVLNKKYASLLWWAGSISSKNQFVSGLFRNICRFLQFIEAAEKNSQEKIIVLTNDMSLIDQIRAYCNENNIKVNLYGWKFRTKSKFFLQIITLISSTSRFLVSGWRRKYLISRNLRETIIGKLNCKKYYYVLRTWIDNRSFNSENKFYDTYFGKLDEYIQKKKNIIILVEILSDFNENLQKIKNNVSNKLIIPQEYFLYYLDYIRALLLSLKKIDIHSDDTKFFGYNVHRLIQNELKSNLFEGEIRNNLLYYFIAKNLSKQVQCDFFTYTFENHSWEKMIILGLKKYSKDTFTIGYQHSNITKRLFNYFNSEKERSIVPYPNKIISVGKVSQKILVKYCNYEESIVKEGCALRYEYIYKTDIFERTKKHNILVATSASINESTKVIEFICRTLKKSHYTIIFRPHPLISFEKIKEKLDDKLNSNFIISKKSNVEQELKTSDILIYTLTSLCLEAVMVGIPVIYVDIDEIYDCDPLFECNHLKWRIGLEKELLKAVNEIYTMSDLEFKKQQILARKYMEDYFLPVTDERLEEFLRK